MRRALLVLLVAVACVVALSVMPATAATDSTANACAPSAFSLSSTLESYVAARNTSASTRSEKPTERYSGGTELPAGKSVRPTGGTIDVYFHVVQKSDGTGAVSDETIADQLTVLNMSFGGMYGGADTGFGFRLARVDTTVNDAWFALETFADEIEMKSSLKRGGPADLNIYSTSASAYLGWAYYPSITASRQYGVLDGVVLDFGSLPDGSITNFNLGLTATHEVGHWLGLAHTFEKGCQGWGDYVDDTPYMSEPTSGCPAGKDTCTRGSGVDPIHNYMDYSYDSCYREFTEGQAERAQKQFAHWRLKRA